MMIIIILPRFWDVVRKCSLIYSLWIWLMCAIISALLFAMCQWVNASEWIIFSLRIFIEAFRSAYAEWAGHRDQLLLPTGKGLDFGVSKNKNQHACECLIMARSLDISIWQRPVKYPISWYEFRMFQVEFAFAFLDVRFLLHPDCFSRPKVSARKRLSGREYVVIFFNGRDDGERERNYTIGTYWNGKKSGTIINNSIGISYWMTLEPILISVCD